jgi:anthranilate phosphoribosyltransferase
VITDRVSSFKEGFDHAREILASRTALELFEQYRREAAE